MGKFLKMLLTIVGVAIGVVFAFTAFTLHWSYSDGERAGYVQKLSRKGWICKTWEGEMALVSMPGTVSDRFAFTVRDDAVAAQINESLGRRLTLSYEQHVGLPTTCFGETSYFVTKVAGIADNP